MDSPNQTLLEEEFCNIARNYEVYLLIGAFTVEGEKDSLNSIICYTPEGKRDDNIYSKRHLVPFGEYVPMRPLIETLVPPLANLVLSSDDVDEGEGSKIMDAGGIGLGCLICFDSIYEQLTYESVRDGAEIICLSTNDSWFSDSAALYMHNAQAQLRAIENRRYVARAANTGISTVINSRGEVIGELGPLVDGRVTATAYANDSMSLCTVIGNGFVYTLLALALALITENFVNKIKINKKTSQGT
jgi:apolipoprotein N-acyltransferase